MDSISEQLQLRNIQQPLIKIFPSFASYLFYFIFFKYQSLLIKL